MRHSRLRTHNHTAYISPTSRVDTSGGDELRQRRMDARDGSARLRDAVLAMLERRARG